MGFPRKLVQGITWRPRYSKASFFVLSAYAMSSPSAVIQIMVSQTIVGYRAWNIAQRSKDSGIFLLVFGFIITVLEWHANLVSRTPVQVDRKYAYRPAWGYPAIQLLFTGQLFPREPNGVLTPMDILSPRHVLRCCRNRSFFVFFDQVNWWC